MSKRTQTENTTTDHAVKKQENVTDDFSLAAEDASDEAMAELNAIQNAAETPVAAPEAETFCEEQPIEVSSALKDVKGKGDHATHADLPAHHKKSRRMRKLLIVIVALLVVLMAALGYLTYLLVQETQNAAMQQVTQDVEAVGKEDTKDASTSVVKKTTVPALVGVLGKTQDEAVKLIGHGALPATAVEVKEEGNSIKSKVTVTLTDEPADTRSGAPTVYLGFNEAGAVIQVGYSAATASLGYGSLSFTDAIQNEKIIEKTFAEAGLTIPAGTVVLPTDKTKYCTYATDGKTLVKENCSFSGTAEANATTYAWSSVLMYDYAAANASGNLADTIRQIYIYINAA
ncbi:MAG: histone-lysine N-methyltransferase [Raoultibacter sp.]